MKNSERVRAVETSGHWLRSWSGIGAIFLMLAAAVLLASCGGAETSSEGNESGGDNEIAFSDFDTDDSGDLNDSEFYDGAYNDWDTDGNGIIEEEEWNTGVDTYYDDYDTSAYGDYGEWDADGDGELTEDEFDESFTDTGIYDDWDADSNDVIDENEFNEAA